MTDALKIVADETKAVAVTEDKKPEVVGPTAAVTPAAEPDVAKK